VEVIIATQDAAIRAALRARLAHDRASREPASAVDDADAANAASEVGSPGEVVEGPIVAGAPLELTEALRRRLAARPDPHGDLLVVSAPGVREAAELVRFSLEQGVPILIWPSIGTEAPRGVSHGHPRLTAREREILALVAGGVSNKGIARALQVSPNTVKFHLAALFHKLAVGTRAEAIAAAARSGELSL
jgi:DNA-binding CsgD family transcriptional regulator